MKAKRFCNLTTLAPRKIIWKRDSIHIKVIREAKANLDRRRSVLLPEYRVPARLW